MWRPPERIRWKSDAGRWPTADQAAASRLFAALDAGPMRLAARTWVPAMVPWRATEDGAVTPEVLAWYERFARGRPAALVVEATGIRDVPSGPLLRIGHDRFIPGLAELVKRVRAASGGETRLLIQLIDFLAIRRRPPPETFFRRYLAITDRHRKALGVATDDEARERLLALDDNALETVLDARELESLRTGYRERVTDTHLPHVRDLPKVLPELFGRAARRAETAGFDGVELHFAHAYTMASFLSALNDRSDGFGGSRAERARLPLQAYDVVRSMISNRFAVGCRFLAEDCIEGGSTVDDAAYYAERFAAAGMDFLSLSRGGKFEDAKQPAIGEAAYPYTGPSGYECMPQFISDTRGPFGRNLEPAARIRAAVRAAGFATPIVVSGGIHGFAQAEAVLTDGQADIVGFARQALADPDWFRKVRLGRGSEIRVCEYTNYCEALDQKHAQVTCKLWDRQSLDEPGLLKSKDGKRRLVAPAWEP
ncbi:MAG: NADH:flavin oxidoreductase [Alphaproteobacteria bacterium]|nr:NADH:flavin oxidoreductase [Alphaproteobacteria bacterium]